jgi:hypothetical protein
MIFVTGLSPALNHEIPVVASKVSANNINIIRVNRSHRERVGTLAQLGDLGATEI